MKLVNISKEEGNYIINTLKTINVFGVEIYSWPKTYTLEENTWVDLRNKKPVKNSTKIKLERWLKVHQKFIEKNS